ncbi:hypothetical protein AB0F20_10120 [Streptomyces goshikiensis]|uniref:hypothetical protein n=1 Tax=Streptomyces goshikiensis TaxID=1942 RepID=UPI0033FB6ECE
MPSEVRSIRICSLLASSGIAVAALSAALTACGSGASTVASPPELPSPSASTAAGPVPGNGTIPVPEGTAAPEGAELPADIAKAAADFAAAWASHDARPGKDAAYTAAGKRAAAYASPDLGASISTPRPSTNTVWQRWTTEKTTVTATVVKVSVPDGAPAPTDTTALARVVYRLTTAPEKGQPTVETKQVALQLDYSDGRWRVIALPYA